MAKKTLKDYFPIIRSRGEVLYEIERKPELLHIFRSWESIYQEEFLDLCCGVRGIKPTYDGFFKELMSPEIHQDRLEQFLSIILGMPVKIFAVLPTDATRISSETVLLIHDVLLELEDHSLVNLEIQKVAMDFPAERASCYSSDLLLRQYKAVKGARGKKFTYYDIKKVYTVILFEDGMPAFRAIPDQYIHHSKQVFDTGLEFNLLQEFFVISLDTYKKNMQNKVIERELDAWLGFFSFDDPKRIIELIGVKPEFRDMYQEMFDICLNVERVMNMFSQELYQLDQNTFRYMIETRNDRLAEQEAQLAEQDAQLAEQGMQLTEQSVQLAEQEEQLKEMQEQINIINKQYGLKSSELLQKDAEIAELRKQLEQKVVDK